MPPKRPPKESAIWAALKRNLKDVHWQRIEGSPGVPDINGCHDGTDFWIEGKVVRTGLKPSWRPGQIAWLVCRAHAGGRAFVLVRHRDTWLLYHASQALALRDQGVRLEPMLRLRPPWDYRGLLAALTGRPDP